MRNDAIDQGLTRHKYHVALSFAGEDRAYVERVADQLKAEGADVFYDRFEEATLWGKNLYTHLHDIYENKALFTVIFVSQAYKKKAWTKHELESAQSHALESEQEYILPAVFDSSVEIPGVLKTIGHINLSNRSPEDLAKIILKKLQESGVELSAQFAYSDEAKADVDFPHSPTTQIGKILNDLKSHDWYTQSPAIKAIFALNYESVEKKSNIRVGKKYLSMWLRWRVGGFGSFRESPRETCRSAAGHCRTPAEWDAL